MTGDTPWVGSYVVQDGVTDGASEFAFTGTIEGVGTGTLTMRDVARTGARGGFVSGMLITGGTGDFQGASGWMLGRSSDGAATGTVEIELRLP